MHRHAKPTTFLIWTTLTAVMAVPILLAATSPLLAWRDPIYILAGIAGVTAMTLLVLQPLLIAGELLGIKHAYRQRMHRITGAILIALILIHVGGLWITSPPDVIDALLFASPTPFSLWGVIAMWAVVAAALLVMWRRRLRIRPQIWHVIHTVLACTTVICAVLHALLIEGTMEPYSKIFLGLCALLAVGIAIRQKRVWAGLKRAKLSKTNRH